MNRNIIDAIFTFLIFALPFKYIPRMLWQTTLGGPFGQDLVVYPLLIGFVYTVYCQWKYKNVFYKWNIFKIFIIAYLTVLLISVVWGLIVYPYYDQILAGPAAQIEKLPGVLTVLHRIGIPIAQKTLLELWMFARPIKGVFFEVLYTFGAAYMIFCWYHNCVERAINILLKVTTINLVIIAAYGLVDVCYQNGQMWAQDFITFTLPLFHGDVAVKFDYYQFHTQLFWDSQNRSIFLEPSYFGIYMSFAFPLLWWNIFRQDSRWRRLAFWLLFITLTFEIFLTQSRTALAVNLGVFVIFSILCLYQRQKNFLVLLVALCIGWGIGFVGSMEFIQTGQIPSQLGEWTPLATKWESMQMKSMGEKGSIGIDAHTYINQNLESLSETDENGAHAVSNHSRFTVQKTHIRIGLEHPLLGVGTTLRQGYLRDKLDQDPGDEIQKWNKNIDKCGMLRAGFANLGDYTLRFAETGFLGLGFYLFPALLLFWAYAKVFIKQRKDVAPFLFISLSFIGIMATGLGDGINITFCYWMAMAVSFLLLGAGDEQCAPLLRFLDSDSKREKYVKQQKIIDIKEKAFKAFTWCRRGKYYGALGQQILLPAVLSICISELILYGLENINSCLGWSMDITATDFISIVATGIGAAGVFLALYCSNIAAVFSARYSRAPSEVFNLFMNNFITSAGVKAVLYYIVYSFCFIYQLWKVPKTSYLLTSIWCFFTIAMVLIFGQLGQKSLMLTDAFKLLRSEYNDIFLSLRLIERKHPLTNGRAIVTIRKALLNNLKTMWIVEGNALSSGDFAKSSLLTFMCNNISLLWCYMEIKERLPFNSPWFPLKQINPKWYEVPEYQKRIAVQMGGGIQPKLVRDSFFFESWIQNINLKGIPCLSSDENLAYRQEYFHFWGEYLALGIPFSEYKYMVDCILTIQKEWVYKWAKNEKNEATTVIAENIGYLYVSYLVGIMKKIQDIDADILIAYVSSCFTLNDIDFKKAPFSNVQECKEFLDRVNIEEVVTGKTLTPRWFVEQFHAKVCFEKIDKIKFDTCQLGINDMKQLFDFVYNQKNYIASAYLLARIQEYYSKWILLAEQIDKYKIQCRKYYVDKKTYSWIENKDDYDQRWKEMLAVMGERRLTVLYHLVSEYDDHALWLQKNMDILGSQFAMINEWMMDTIIENNIVSFKQSYKLFKQTVVFYSQIINQTIEIDGKNALWLVNQVSHPAIDFIVISGYALLWGEAVEDVEWKEEMEASADSNLDNYLLWTFMLWRFYTSVDADEIRFDWKRNMEIAIEKLPVFEKIRNQEHQVLLKKSNSKQNYVLKQCLHCMHDHCLVESNRVYELYPIMILNKAVSMDKRYKSRYWKMGEKI